MSGEWHGGKGSKARPFSVSQDEFGDNYDLIFGQKDRNKTKNILNNSNSQTHTKANTHNTDTQEK
jgi:hypothetical protein